MSRYLKAVINIVLLLVAVQVFNLNTAECAAMSADGSVTVNAALSSVASHCFETGILHDVSKDQPAGTHHHHHKVFKKYFPGKVMLGAEQKLSPVLCHQTNLLHSAEVAGYRYLYFKNINPPPSKA